MAKNSVSTITAGGKEYTIKFDINRLCDLEERFDMSIGEIAKSLEGNPRITKLRGLVWAGLRDIDGQRASDEEAGAVLTVLGIAKASELIGEGINACFGTAKA